MTRNLMPARDREASVASVEVALEPEALRQHFLGREAYRRTRFIIARRGERAAVLRVEKASEEPLFSPIVRVELLAGPEECALIRAPDIDTGNPSQMAGIARARGPAARCAVVHGRYEHVSFILEPSPLAVRVLDVVPPDPPKLLDQARRILDVAEDLPPVELQPELIDLRALARQEAAERYLFPCRGSGALPDGQADYLDQRPPHRDWTLVGCARSREIYRWFYGEEPHRVETCPLQLASGTREPTLTKCCLLERQVRREGSVVAVPWGATLDEVRQGLEQLLRAIEPAWSAA
ncbi:MAG: hypothetical protein JOZ41_07320 [Chloroflexi bacterium]|nr:hypothetical protein [Chloroflexota bacterium]